MDRDRHTYAVTVATGNIGGRLARGLLEAGHRVRALGRDASRLQDLVALGATPFVGDSADPAFLERAFRGADAAFLVVKADQGAPDFRAAFLRVGEQYAAAARAAGLANALFVSSMGAHDPELDGLIGIHREVEALLDEVPGLNAVHLRAGSFFKNLFYFLPAIRAAGALATPLAPDAPIDWAATDDLAQVALRTLVELPLRRGQVIEARGAERRSIAELARVIEAQLGRPFPAVHVARDADLRGMAAAGLSPDMAERMHLTWEIMSAVSLRNQAPGATALLPTSIESFVRETIVPALTPAERRHVRIEYRLRDDVDLDAFKQRVAEFVAGLRAHRADSVYTSYQATDDPRRFVHVGDFAADAVPSLQAEPFFRRFSAGMRELCAAGPEVIQLVAVASTSASSR